MGGRKIALTTLTFQPAACVWRESEQYSYLYRNYNAFSENMSMIFICCIKTTVYTRISPSTNLRVLSSDGFLSILIHSPLSITFPAYIIITLSHIRAAWARLCVTITTVVSSFARVESSIFSISDVVYGSMLAVGSSRRRS